MPDTQIIFEERFLYAAKMGSLSRLMKFRIISKSRHKQTRRNKKTKDSKVFQDKLVTKKEKCPIKNTKKCHNEQ